MMARRMMRKHHVRCRAGEKVETTSKPYLSLSILVECGKMLQRGAPKLGKDGKPMKDKHGKVIYEPYRIKVLIPSTSENQCTKTLSPISIAKRTS